MFRLCACVCVRVFALVLRCVSLRCVSSSLHVMVHAHRREPYLCVCGARVLGNLFMLHSCARTHGPWSAACLLHAWQRVLGVFAFCLRVGWCVWVCVMLIPARLRMNQQRFSCVLCAYFAQANTRLYDVAWSSALNGFLMDWEYCELKYVSTSIYLRCCSNEIQASMKKHE